MIGFLHPAHIFLRLGRRPTIRLERTRTIGFSLVFGILTLIGNYKATWFLLGIVIGLGMYPQPSRALE